LQGVIIENRDALSIIRAQDTPETLFFMDPPYLPCTRGASGGYRHELTEQQHIELLHTLSSIRGRAMVAGYLSTPASPLSPG
jgi:DNA adenine methylase